MPTYDYKCQKCGHQFEVFQSMKDDRLTDCPLEECEGPVKRLLGTGAGIIFKGSGFYETDYRSASYKKGQTADSAGSSSGDSGGSSSGTSDSKPTPPSTPAPASAPAKSDT
jgi:putative FmdB family regulatory protein